MATKTKATVNKPEETSRFIDPFTDFGFKLIFGEEASLMDFLNDLLQAEQGKITEIQYLNSERLGRSAKDRKAFFDLYCTNERGEKFIVELQRTWQQNFKDRMVYYTSIPITGQVPRGKWNYELKAVYMIAILDFTFDDNAHNLDKYRYDVQLVDTETNEVFYDKLQLVCLEMPKFTKELEELEESGNHFEKWMYVIKHLPMLKEIPTTLKKDKTFNRLFTRAEIANLSPRQRRAYDLSLKDYRDYHHVIHSTRQRGKEEGMKQGVEKGLQQKQLEIAMNMLKEGFGLPIIQKLTGLNQETIEELQ